MSEPMWEVWRVDGEHRAAVVPFSEATYAIEELDRLGREYRELAFATNAYCTAPDCSAPALVPDGLCRKHADEKAVEILRVFGDRLRVRPPSIYASETLSEILALYGITSEETDP
jgi:hypothetical protein